MGARGGRGNARRVTAGGTVAALVLSVCVMVTGGAASAAPVDSITRVASGIDRPEGIVQGPDGNLWFTSSGNDTIGRSTPTGTVSFFTGTGIDEPRDITVGPDGALWFTNLGNDSLGRISTAGAVTNVAVGGLVLAGGIATGADGNLWVTDTTSNTVIRVTPAGVATTYPGVVTAPRAIVAGPDGNLWVTSTTENQIAKVSTAGALLASFDEDDDIAGPTSITVGPDGALWYINDSGFGGGFGRITPAGASTSFDGPPMFPAKSIVSGADGNLWFEFVTGTVGRLSTAGVITLFERSGSDNEIRAIAPGPGGAIWFVDDGSLGSVNTSGTFSTFNGSGLAAPRSIVGGPDGNLWITNQGSDTVTRMTTAGVTTAFTAGGVVNPQEIVVGPDGNLWFANVGNSTIGRITTAGVITTFAVTGGTAHGSITSGPDGNLWFTASTSAGFSAIGRITTAGVVTLFTGSGIAGPNDITAGPDGNLWFTNPLMHSIGRITPSGVVTAFTEPGGLGEPGEIKAPSGITTGPDGSLWFVGGLGSISRISTSGRVVTFPAPPDMLMDEEIVAGPDGALWYTRSLSGSIGRFGGDGTYSTHTDPSIAGGPNAIAVGADGNLWFTTDRSTVGKVALTRTTPDAAAAPFATPGYAQATVQWGPPAYTGGSAITGYVVTSSPGGKTCTTTGALSCVVGGLTNGNAYTFSVKATNAQGVSPASPPSTSVTLFPGSTFHPMIPYRILDSRGPHGGWNGKVTAGTPRPVGVAAGSLGVPLTASAAILNVTVVDSDSDSFLTVYPNQPFPTSPPPPTASNLNFSAGQIVPNLVTVKLGTLGGVLVANAVGSTHVVIDVVGYYDDGIATAGGAQFNPITPRRLLDSRGPNGDWNGKIAQGAPRDLQVRAPGNPNGVPVGATAVVANVTVTQADAQSFLSVYPSGGNVPEVSNLNFLAGQTVPNLVTVGIGSNGAIRFANAVGSVHVIVDVVGYYEPGVGARFFGVNPTRVLDSRIGTGLIGSWSAGQTRSLDIGGAAGTNVPAAATGVVTNVTVADSTAESLVTVFPGNVNIRPNSSNLNFKSGQVVPNLVAVGLAPNGTVKLYNDQGTVNLVADVVGYFAP